jgi:hypothetical protein
MARRALETFAVAKWSDTRRKSEFSFTRELAAMGDFNMPMSVPGDSIFDALTKLGLGDPGPFLPDRLQHHERFAVRPGRVLSRDDAELIYGEGGV